MFQKIRQSYFQFMQGRYGTDQLCLVMLGASLLIQLAAQFTHRWPWLLLALELAAWALLILSVFRALSKNIGKRRAENAKLLSLGTIVKKKWNKAALMWKERKTHRYFPCPGCHQTLRVPKGRGKISVTCPKCKTEFIKKT